ncbi:MAG: MOSC domain-containing protein [bacterium]
MTDSSAGILLAVCLGPGGIPKAVVPEAEVTEDGLVGDGHRSPRHGGRDRAVCLFSAEDQARLVRAGVPCTQPGSFGENVLTEGLDFRSIRPGDHIALGPEVRLEVHDVRSPCDTLKSLDERLPNLLQGRSGFICSVLSGGRIEAGMTVCRVESPSP